MRRDHIEIWNVVARNADLLALPLLRRVSLETNEPRDLVQSNTKQSGSGASSSSTSSQAGHRDPRRRCRNGRAFRHRIRALGLRTGFPSGAIWLVAAFGLAWTLALANLARVVSWTTPPWLAGPRRAAKQAQDEQVRRTLCICVRWRGGFLLQRRGRRDVGLAECLGQLAGIVRH